MKPLTRVAEWRERQMLTQKELAEKAGVSVFTVQRIESGRGGAHPSTGRKIAAALGVGPEELTDEASTPKVEATQRARWWLEDLLGHSFLAMDDWEARKYQEGLAVEDVASLRARLGDEYNVAREALESWSLDPALRAELQDAKKTLPHWHRELTTLLRNEEQKQQGHLPVQKEPGQEGSMKDHALRQGLGSERSEDGRLL